MNFFGELTLREKIGRAGVHRVHPFRNRSVAVSPDGTTDNPQLKRKERVMAFPLYLDLSGYLNVIMVQGLQKRPALVKTIISMTAPRSIGRFDVLPNISHM